ncbi:hypothetical protein [Paraburkholderia sediminicola]|uniref:hypothetical protein n=1 Tax=Paraburkholderia sediminicola TaxID=458836 RepID=UPI0038B8EBE9
MVEIQSDKRPPVLHLRAADSASITHIRIARSAAGVDRSRQGTFSNVNQIGAEFPAERTESPQTKGCLTMESFALNVFVRAPNIRSFIDAGRILGVSASNIGKSVTRLAQSLGGKVVSPQHLQRHL